MLRWLPLQRIQTLLHSRTSISPLLLPPEGKSTIPSTGKMPSTSRHTTLLPGWTLPRLLCVSARPPVLMKLCAAQQQGFALHAQCLHAAPCLTISMLFHLWPQSFAITRVPIPASKDLLKDYRKNFMTGRLLLYAASTACWTHFSVLCISSRRLLVFIKKVV